MAIRVPDDTRTLHAIGDYIYNLDPANNPFLPALYNRIGMVLVTSRTWNNPWSRFDKGRLELGETVEEVFSNIVKVHSFDPATAEKEVYKREFPDVRAAFHTMNWQKLYKVTISRDQLRQAFNSWGDLDRLITGIVTSMYTALELDTWLTTKYMLSRAILNGFFHTVVTPSIDGDADAKKSVIAAYREYTSNMTLLKSTYNHAGVRNSTPIESQVIMIPNHAEAVLGVNVLADAFQLAQVDYIGNRIAVDSFEFDADDTRRLAELFANDPSYTPFTGAEIAKLQKVTALKFDEGIFMIFRELDEYSTLYNNQGLYWNHYLSAWRTFSLSPFANAIVFTSEATEVTGVTVSPATANVAQGSEAVFTATVEGTGLFDRSVIWTIEGNSSNETRIDPDSGRLFVAPTETADGTITVTATATDGQTGTATVTVVAR